MSRLQPGLTLLSISQLPMASTGKPKSQSKPKPYVGKDGKKELLCIPRRWVATAQINSSFCMSFTGDHPV